MSDTIVKALPYSVDLAKPIKKSYLDTLFATEDNQAHRFDITLKRNGSDVTPDSGTSVSAYFIRYADNATVPLTGSVSGSVVSVTLSKACYTKAGQFALIIKAATGSTVSTVFYAEGTIYTSSTDTIVDEENIIPSLSDLLAQIDAMEAATEAANTATANANTATGKANTAAQTANTAARGANTARDNANTAAGAANTAAGKIDAMTVSATPVDTGTATAELTTVDGHYHLALGLPKGDTGATPKISVQVQTGAAGSEAAVSVTGTAENPVIHLTIPRGDTGAVENLTINGKPVESGTITLTAEDVGARPDTWMPTASDVGALPAGDTAANSRKLGGKAPEYYIQPRNLLDNSDFTNPVNQRGATTWTNGTSKSYSALDRWCTARGNFQITNDGLLMAWDGINANSAYVQQIILNPYQDGEVVTICANVDGAVKVESFAIPSVGNTKYSAVDSDGFYFGLGRDSEKLYISMFSNQTENICIRWAALYEGTYTIDTLPPYVPKGYSAELLECQRYCLPLKSTTGENIVGYGFVLSARVARIFIPTPIRMRTVPNIIFSTGSITDSYIQTSSGSVKATGISVLSISHNGVTVLVNTSADMTANTCVIYRMPNAQALLTSDL